MSSGAEAPAVATDDIDAIRRKLYLRAIGLALIIFGVPCLVWPFLGIPAIMLGCRLRCGCCKGNCGPCVRNPMCLSKILTSLGFFFAALHVVYGIGFFAYYKTKDLHCAQIFSGTQWGDLATNTGVQVNGIGGFGREINIAGSYNVDRYRAHKDDIDANCDACAAQGGCPDFTWRCNLCDSVTSWGVYALLFGLLIELPVAYLGKLVKGILIKQQRANTRAGQ